MGDSQGWYVEGSDGQSIGPLSADEVLQRRRQGAVTDQTLCWREGMADWAKLAQAEPFATELRRWRARKRRAALRAVVILALLGGVGGAGYLMWQRAKGPQPVRDARALLDSGQEQQAITALEGYLKEQPASAQALELLGIAMLRQYAAAPVQSNRTGTGDPRQDLQVQAALEHLARAVAQDQEALRDLGPELAAIAVSVPESVPDRLARVTALAGVRERLKLAAPEALADEVIRVAAGTSPEQLRRPENEPVWQCLLGWKPSLSGELLALLLSAGPVQGAQAEQTINLVVRCAAGNPEAIEPLAPAALEIAQRLRGSDVAAARAALAKALEWAPDLAQREDVLALAIDLSPQPGTDKLARCVEFLRQFPQSARCAETRMLLLGDAVAFFDASGWQQDRAAPYLRAAEEAAAGLLAGQPQPPELAERVLALARRVVQSTERKQGEREAGLRRGIELADAILIAIPATPRRLEIEQAKQEWRQALGRGTLDAPFDPLVDYVEEHLKILDLSSPGTLQLLADQPRAFHVVRALCAEDRLNSTQAETLRAWVADGGVLWLGNAEARSILNIFDLSFSYQAAGPPLCRPASAPPDCALSAGCTQVQLNCQYADVTDLNGSGVIPLLSNGEHILWSAARYGKGWVSDVKSVDRNRYDGARFWLNFQLFSMGDCGRIPGAGAAPAEAPAAAVPAETPPVREPAAPDPVRAEAQAICRSLDARPADLALLAELVRVCERMTEEYRKGRCLAICYLGYALAGRPAEAQQVMRQIEQLPADNRFVRSLARPNLLESCATCGGRGQTIASCTACNGRGRRGCTQCGGSGRIARRFGGTPAACPMCKGQGQIPCATCAGKGSSTQPCRACNGRGQWVSEKKLRDLYATYLKEAEL